MKVLSAAEWRTDVDGDVAFLWRDRVSRGTILDGDGERKCRASRKIGERSLSSEDGRTDARTDGRIVGRLVQKNDATQKKEEKKGKRRRTSSPSFCCRVLPLLTSPYLSRGKMFLPMGAFQTVLRFGHATRRDRTRWGRKKRKYLHTGSGLDSRSISNISLQNSRRV